MTFKHAPRSLALAALIGAGCFIAAGIVPTASAQAQESQTCGPRATFVKTLAGEFRERTVAVGLVSDGSAIAEVLTSPDGATWTMLFTLPTGISCVVATGQNWQRAPEISEVGAPT